MKPTWRRLSSGRPPDRRLIHLPSLIFFREYLQVLKLHGGKRVPIRVNPGNSPIHTRRSPRGHAALFVTIRSERQPMLELDDLSWLTSQQANAWLLDLAHDNRPIHQQLTYLRKQLSGAKAGLLVQQAALRKHAFRKFGFWAEQMLFTDKSLQQATDRWIAAYKAARYSRSVAVHDLCCGIGGDLLGLASRGERKEEPASTWNQTTDTRTIGWDLSAPVTRLAKYNLHAVLGRSAKRIVDVVTGDVESLTLPAKALWHLDPDRRPGQKRTSQATMHRPGPEAVERLLKTHPDGAVKLAPACQVPANWAKSAELEWISRDRECRQLVAWFGELANHPGKHRATLLSHDKPSHQTPSKARPGDPAIDSLVSYSLAGQAGRQLPTAKRLGRFLIDPDPAILAANLLGELAHQHDLAALVHEGAYLTSDHPVDNPLTACFEVLEQLPLRVKPLAKYLASRDLGSLEIKKRGVALEPSVLRRQLKLRGSRTATLILARLGQREVAILAQRCPRPGAAK